MERVGKSYCSLKCFKELTWPPKSQADQVSVGCAGQAIQTHGVSKSQFKGSVDVYVTIKDYLRILKDGCKPCFRELTTLTGQR